MLLIIDNQSTYIKRWKRNVLSEHDIDYIVFDHNEPLIVKKDSEVRGIILSGGKGNPYEPLNLTSNFIALMNFDVPVLGFCLGHEIIAVANRGRIQRLQDYQNKKELVTLVKKDDPIFDGIETEQVLLQKKHHFHVSSLPHDFVVLGRSNMCPYEIIRHKDRPIYGFQSHPEVSQPLGVKIVDNFLRICGML